MVGARARHLFKVRLELVHTLPVDFRIYLALLRELGKETNRHVRPTHTLEGHPHHLCI
jgi:hypothetical protein